jgi:glycosyltransferase involved in cell wall biosynthesis
MPLVSVIMPFHRITPHLRPAVDSVLGQTLADLELLLVDNGTGAGLTSLGAAGKDPRIRLIAFPQNRGACLARNAAIAEARGEFVAFLDYDDLAHPARLERQVARLRARPGVGLVGSWVEAIDAEGRVLGPEFALTGGKDQYVFSQYTMPAPISCYTARREVCARFPFRPGMERAEDYDFLARTAEACELDAIPEVLLGYRTHAGQTTREQQPAQIAVASLIRLLTARRRAGRAEDWPRLQEEFADWLRQPPVPEVTYAAFARRCLEEGFPRLAVYHARKLVSVRRQPGALLTATRCFATAWRDAPGERAFLARLFLGGPLRAHGLRPAA